MALSLSDFSLEKYFISLRAVEELDGQVDEIVTGAQAKLKTIIRPEPIGILWESAIRLPGSSSKADVAFSSPTTRYGLYKLFENVFQVNHRNQGVLASLNLVRTLFPRFLDSRSDAEASERERHALQKLLRRLLEMGSTTEEARTILKHAVVTEEDGQEKLDLEMLDLVRFGMKSRWTEHLSLESPAALVVHEDSCKSLPIPGFTFMMWVYLSKHPTGAPCTLFAATLGSRRLFQLSIRPDGKLRLSSSGQPDKEPPFACTAAVRKNRWVHITMVHYPHRGTNPSIREWLNVHDSLTTMGLILSRFVC